MLRVSKTRAFCLFLQFISLWRFLASANPLFTSGFSEIRVCFSFSAANLLNSSYDDSSSAKACAIVETASNNNEISVVDNENNHALITSSVDRSEYGAPGERERI